MEPSFTPLLECKYLVDGSFTLFEPGVGEHYHNRVGAYTESLAQYAVLALEHWQQRGGIMPHSLRVWDVCFGLGYNSFTLIHYLAQKAETGNVPLGLHLDIQAVELDEALIPLWQQVLALPVYPLFHPETGAYQITCVREVQAVCYTFTPIAPHPGPIVTLSVAMGDALSIVPQWQSQLNNARVHAIFHDAFSPRKVPHLWSPSLFQTYADALCPQQGILLTYSVARIVKNAMELAGLQWHKTEALHQLGHTKGGLMATWVPVHTQP
jgi:tRNA U34 5-methylaminomethyl-2-thiouridine-forming methyltransferase MnmC